MRQRVGRLAVPLAALALILGSGSAPATAGSFDFLFSMSRVGDDNQYFLNLTVGSFGYDRVVLEPVLPRLRSVELDLPVVLFLARESGRPIDFIVGLRARGLTWAVIFGQIGVPFDVLFVGIDRDPGPPYGKAWGYWRKSPRGAALTDVDIAGLVSVQIGARLGGLSPFEVARARGKGKRVAALVAEKKGRPYHAGKPEKAGERGKGRKPDQGQKPDKGPKPGKPHGER
jgi:hypothetical protein